jgi:hypothetical protein
MVGFVAPKTLVRQWCHETLLFPASAVAATRALIARTTLKALSPSD